MVVCCCCGCGWLLSFLGANDLGVLYIFQKSAIECVPKLTLPILRYCRLGNTPIAMATGPENSGSTRESEDRASRLHEDGFIVNSVLYKYESVKVRKDANPTLA